MLAKSCFCNVFNIQQVCEASNVVGKGNRKQVADSNTTPVESCDWFAHSMLKASFVPVSRNVFHTQQHCVRAFSLQCYQVLRWEISSADFPEY